MAMERETPQDTHQFTSTGMVTNGADWSKAMDRVLSSMETRITQIGITQLAILAVTTVHLHQVHALIATWFTMFNFG